MRESFAGKRIRRFCASEAEAWAVGADIVSRIRSGGVSSLDTGDGLTVSRAAEMFLPRMAGKSKSHREKTEKFLRRLGAHFGQLSGVSAPDLERWIRSAGSSPTSQATAYRYARMFFRWCVRTGLCERDPLVPVDCPRARPRRRILSPDEMRAVLAREMPDWLRASIVLGGFAGLRTEEVLRMRWEDVRLQDKAVHIRPGVGKDAGGFDQRIVEFTAPITRRGGLFEGRSGQLVTIYRRGFHDVRRRLARSLGWDHWPDNCLRHSFATYHLAECGNPALTAFQMGHTSSAMVQRVYAVPARLADARAWWGL